MRPVPLVALALSCPSLAWGATPDVTVTSSAALTPDAPTPAVVVPTLGPDVAFDGTWNPALRFGLSANVGLTFGPRDRVSARWGVWRDQRFCDTCDAGQGPVGVGPDTLGSTDLDLAGTHRFSLGESGELWATALLTLPASRDALACNVMYAAPGAAASFRLPVKESQLAVGVAARRPIYATGAAPVGGCTSGPVPSVDTLAGAVSASSWAGQRWGAANPSLTANASLTGLELEDLVGGVDPRVTSVVSVGLFAVRDAAAPAVQVDTLAGEATVAAANEPVSVQFPWSVSAGWMFTRQSSLSLSAANQLPALLADPGGTLRAQPAGTQLGLSFSSSFPSLEVR